MDSSSSSSLSDDSDPEVRDEGFREASASSTQDENRVSLAEELALLKESAKTRMLFFQLFQSLPSVKQPAVAGRRKEVLDLPGLPAGYTAKTTVYKSGKVEMKHREMKHRDPRFNASPGVERKLAAINFAEKSQQNEGIPLDSGNTHEDFSLQELRKNLLSLSLYRDQVKEWYQDLTKINPEKEIGLMDESDDNHLLFFQLPSSLTVAKQPIAAAKGKEIKSEGKYKARDATSSRSKQIEDKSSKKSDGNIQEDDGV